MINPIKKELEALAVQMISALHLLWIIPLCFLLGVLVLGFVVGATRTNKESDIYQEGVREGMKRAGCPTPTLESYIMKNYKGNTKTFLDYFTGFIYGVEENGQLEMLFLDENDISNYKNCELLNISGEFMGIQRPIIKMK